MFSFSRRIGPFAILLCFSFLSTIMHGEELSFAKPALEITAKPGEQSLAAIYNFTNNTKKVLTIQRYESECSCMEIATKDKKLIFEPGESGEIHGNFMIGVATGTLEKSIRVWLAGDQADRPSTTLKLKVIIPELVQIEPKSLLWTVGEKPVVKISKLTFSGDKPVQIIKISCSDPIFGYEIRPTRAGKDYELKVTCSSTTQKAMGILKLETDSSFENQKIVQLFAVVK